MRLTRTRQLVAIALFLSALVVSASASADSVPTFGPGFAVHYDPLPPGAFVPLLAAPQLLGPPGQDNLNGGFWIWELEFFNPGAAAANIRVENPASPRCGSAGSASSLRRA
jgi:hypothetical protein